MLVFSETLHPATVKTVLALSFCLGVVACLGVLAHTLIHKRKALTQYARWSSSPPPEPVKRTTEVDYTKVFPPSQRYLLSDISSTFSSSNVDLSVKPLLRLDEDYRHASPTKYNFTGFSIREIKQLGDFPDYAKLSGVPLPTPLKSFNVKTALPRPYRPFRWAYHQTMCK